MQAEDAPQLSNRVDLDPEVRDLDRLAAPRITYKNHPLGARHPGLFSPKLVDLLGASGAAYGFIAPADAVPTSRHVLGTLRFGSDPKTSVCDPNGKLHDLGNLFAADGSLFPTSAGFNPTLTIATLSMWVAANMVSPTSPEKALV